MTVYKTVIQVPFDDVLADELLDLRWQATEDPHGPHIKVYPESRDAETSEPCIFVRCKHTSATELRALTERVWAVVEDAD